MRDILTVNNLSLNVCKRQANQALGMSYAQAEYPGPLTCQRRDSPTTSDSEGGRGSEICRQRGAIRDIVS
ncbi:hypothetical protein HZ326_16045 [Fusarium oxysporum f. sp. albedinis]|nr:hypothetical protein HZ326_16045 [Fusarium oxysporum f. sp. albedinis]